MPYYPKSKYSKPKSAGQEEFVLKTTKEYYKGYYVETFDKKYFAGTSPLDGIELEKVKEHQLGLDEGIPFAFGILANSLGGFFRKKPTNSEKERGVTKRYFVQDLNNNKIAETDKVSYVQTKLQVPNRNFLEVDWVIKGPAKDQMFGNYLYEGAETRNRKTIQALEKNMPGISTFITDYKELVEEPVIVPPQDKTSQTFVERDANEQLQNDRKANFDLRK